MHPWHPDCVLSSVNSTSVCYFCVLSSVNSTSVCYFSGYLAGMTGIWLNAKRVCIQNGSALPPGLVGIDRQGASV